MSEISDIDSMTDGDAVIPSSKRESGRSVTDYENEADLYHALASCTISAGHSCAAPPPGKSDWVLPVHDHDAEDQHVNHELHRLLVLKSYLLLDAEKEAAFDRLTEEACEFYNVPTSLISLIDLGRQFFFSNTGAHNNVRETSRVIAFCSHAILSKTGVMVVPDCAKDPRFQNNELVTSEDGPQLRFYAAAPLISPEGYKLGTFCVESPEPRPEGLTEAEKEKLKDYAAKTMDLMVERRRKILQKDMVFNLPVNEPLRRHAAVATNLGEMMYHSDEFVTAMRLFQESVQTLMHVEEDTESVCLPATERQEAMYQILLELTKDSDVDDPSALPSMIAKVKEFFDVDEAIPSIAKSCNATIHGIPGLFSGASKLKSVAAHRHFHGLIFSEAFKVSMEKDTYQGDLSKRPIDDRSFVIPLEQCSKATLFNMGLIHYHWGSPDSAVQFFDLAASLSQQHDALSFDPVILGCLNNMAQIHLQYGRPTDAMALISDAVTRGNAALVAMYGGDEHDDDIRRQNDIKRTRRLRKKLARTVLNMGHVHFVRCDYDASLTSCNDVLRLLHTNMDEPEVAAVWYNSALLNYYNGNKTEALKYLDKFLEMAVVITGRNNLQFAEGLHRKGQVLFESGNLDEAIPCLSEALETRRAVLGNCHPAIADSYFIIGKVMQVKQEYDFSLISFEKGLLIQRSLSQEDISFDLAQSLIEIGRIHHIKGRYKESIQIYKEVLDLAKKFFGEDHPFVTRISNILTNLYKESGEPEILNDHFNEATKIETEDVMEMKETQDPR